MAEDQIMLARGRLERELNNLNKEIKDITLNMDIKEFTTWQVLSQSNYYKKIIAITQRADF